MKKKLQLIILLAVSVLFQGTGQVSNIGSISVTNFSRSDYQAGTQNWAIEQDERGIVYFANNKGLLTFDGTHWQVTGLPNGTIVRSIVLDENGRAFLGGQNEFGYLTVAKEDSSPVYISLGSLVPEAFKNFEDVWKIFINPNGVYFCTEKAIFHLEGEELKILEPSSRFENFFQIGNRILVQEFGEGLFEIKNKSLISIAGPSFMPNERIAAILPFNEEQSLIFTLSDGMFFLDENGVRPWTSAPANKFLKNNQVYSAIQLLDGRYAVGTPHNGLLIFDHQGNPVQNLNVKRGLQNNTVLAIMEDIQHNLWLGLDNGIDYAEINSPFSKIRTEEGIAGTGYASIVHDDKLYLGTNQGLFYRKLNVDSEDSKFKLVENGLGQVWSIDRIDNKIIVGQHSGAAYLDGNKLEPFSDIKGAWKFLRLKSNPNYGIEGSYSGLHLYEVENGEWKLIEKINGFDESARVLEEDAAGNIWVSHNYKGLYKIELNEDLKSVKSVVLYSRTNGLPEELVINVAKVRNELVFATPHGVYQYDNALDTFQLHQDFLEIFGVNRNFYRLIEDEIGNIWFSVDNEFGVIKIQEQGVFNRFHIQYFNQIQDDLVDGFEHVYANSEKDFFIGTEKGFMRYQPLEEKNKAFKFKALIREVSSITQGDSTIYRGNPTNHDFKFNYRMNDFRFVFSAPYYEKISYLKFRYKLKGFEENWTEWTSKSEKEYTNLDPGDYQFLVQARNAYGQLSEDAYFEFTVNEPWYWSWIMKIIYAILGFLTLGGLIKFVSKQEKKKTAAFKLEQTRRLERKEAEFKKEVEKSEGEIIKLRNDKLNSDIKHKNSQLASATMHLVQKTEILNKIKTDLVNIETESPGDVKKKIKQITRTIESDIQLDESWTQFETYFDQVHENFFKRLREKFPKLTPKDQKLCAYLRMNLSTKEIAPLLNISVRGVEISRYRLRKKLAIESEVNLVAYIMEV
jgi:Y_Y_Y domain./Bacterial regulatory proteins, luxR family.